MKNAITIVLLAGLFASAVGAARAQTIWTGPTTTFTKPDSADWTLPQNQDRLTGNVWITRQNTHGIFNIAQETGYIRDVSPVGTEWAYGTAQNWQSLSFAAWELWAASSPPTTVGKDAVLHLVTDDVYLDIKFLSWASGATAGGGFSYQRSSPEPEKLAGDANGDRVVNDTDASILGAHWMSTGAQWVDGDFNGDNVVNDRDAAILAAHWGQTGAGAANVPEPASLALVLGGSLSLLALRRRSVWTGERQRNSSRSA
jgi:hypothetical protein